jgi:hypothetical protein
LIDRKPMVIGRADSPEGAKVNQSIAMLLLQTALFDSAITSFTFPSVYAASCDAADAAASDFRISHGRVAR